MRGVFVREDLARRMLVIGRRGAVTLGARDFKTLRRGKMPLIMVVRDQVVTLRYIRVQLALCRGDDADDEYSHVIPALLSPFGIGSLENLTDQIIRSFSFSSSASA